MLGKAIFATFFLVPFSKGTAAVPSNDDVPAAGRRSVSVRADEGALSEGKSSDLLPNDSLAAAIVQAYSSNPTLAASRYDLRATDDELGIAMAKARTSVDLQVSGEYDLTLPGRTTQASRPLVDRLNDPNIERNALATSLVADRNCSRGWLAVA